MKQPRAAGKLHFSWRHGVEVAFALLIGAWLLLPLMPGVRGAVDLVLLPGILGGGAASAAGRVAARGLGWLLVGFLAATALSKLAAPLPVRRLGRLFDPSRLLPILLGFIASLLAVGAPLLQAQVLARGPGYFAGLHPLVYAAFLLSAVANLFYLLRLIRAMNRREEVYRGYGESSRGRSQGGRRGMRDRAGRGGIRRRLVLLLTGITLVIVCVLSLVLLQDFRGTILATVLDNGRNLVERSASVVKANLADPIAINDYFEIERRKNLEAKVRFNSLAYYQKQGKGERYLAVSSTDATLLEADLPGRLREVSGEGGPYENGAGTLAFVAPVTLGRGEEAKVAGFTVVAYDRSVVYEPYFRTQLKVILFSGLFLYVAVVLVYLLGGSIALPILALGASVNRISTALSSMMAGKVRVSASLLDYKDMVRSRDEVKGLSVEFSRMAAVIRGLVPYISASTLKHADRGAPVSQSKELAFLFTDIRGFSKLCEGLGPDEVVGILNKFLDLQSSIILENDGDIDKFVGDAIMAFFEGEDKELKACRAAVGIRRAMAAETARRSAGRQRLVAIGIGVHSGAVVFGSVGARNRMDFTSIGDAVNLAARLEEANKEYGTGSLISEVVHERVKADYLCREIDCLAPKGRSKPVRVFEILEELQTGSAASAELKQRFEQGLSEYRQRQWEQARQSFRYLAKKRRDAASRVFLRRIELLRRNPPPRDWDGVFGRGIPCR
jgi:class 3 adenylate cyclase